MKTAFVFASLLVAGCGTPAVDDLTDLQPDVDVKADAVLPRGAWEIAAATLQADDVVYLNLLGAPTAEPPYPSWVWNRCYDTPCSQLVPQDGTYAFYKSKSGRRYIVFYTTHIDPPAPPSPKTTKTTPPPSAGDEIDAYQWSIKSGTLRLRKANTTRWFTLTRFTDQAACDESGGTFANGACDCSALGTGAFNSPPVFQPGMGGCFLLPSSGETMCDDTGGAYTDDENNLVGTFCECGVGRYFADGVGCTDVP